MFFFANCSLTLRLVALAEFGRELKKYKLSFLLCAGPLRAKRKCDPQVKEHGAGEKETGKRSTARKTSK